MLEIVKRLCVFDWNSQPDVTDSVLDVRLTAAPCTTECLPADNRIEAELSCAWSPASHETLSVLRTLTSFTAWMTVVELLNTDKAPPCSTSLGALSAAAEVPRTVTEPYE